jgi:hypothetical protein
MLKALEFPSSAAYYKDLETDDIDRAIVTRVWKYLLLLFVHRRKSVGERSSELGFARKADDLAL